MVLVVRTAPLSEELEHTTSRETFLTRAGLSTLRSGDVLSSLWGLVWEPRGVLAAGTTWTTRPRTRSMGNTLPRPALCVKNGRCPGGLGSGLVPFFPGGAPPMKPARAGLCSGGLYSCCGGKLTKQLLIEKPLVLQPNFCSSPSCFTSQTFCGAAPAPHFQQKLAERRLLVPGISSAEVSFPDAQPISVTFLHFTRLSHKFQVSLDACCSHFSPIVGPFFCPISFR